MKNKKKDVTLELELEDSFKALVLKYPFEKITIKMITDGAGVIRPTFYNHYADKYEMLEVICYKDLFQGSELLIENDMSEEAVLFIFSKIEKNKDFYIQAIKVKGQNAFEDIIYINFVKMFVRLFKVHTSKNAIVEKDKIFTVDNLAHYYSKGLTFIIIRWIESGVVISAKEMVKKYRLIMTNSFDGVMKILF